MPFNVWTIERQAAEEPKPWEVLQLAQQIAPLLTGKHPVTQSGALADLLATMLAGYPEAVREEVLAKHLELVRVLMPVNAQQLAERMKTEGSA